MSAALVAGCAAGGVLLAPALDAVTRAVPPEGPLTRPVLRRPDGRTALVALGAALLAGLVAAADGASPVLAPHLLLAALAVVLVVTDLEHQRLPNVLLAVGGTGLAGLLAVAAWVSSSGDALVRAGLGAAVLFAVFLLLAVVSPAGLGMGDVKLVAVLGLALGFAGWDRLLLGMLAAFAVHAVVSLVLLLARRVGRRTGLPLGPALLLGTALALGWFAPLLPS